MGDEDRYAARNRRSPGQREQSSADKLHQMPAVVVLERMPAPVLAIDQDGAILFANAAFAAMLGYTQRSLVLQLGFPQIFQNQRAEASAVVIMHAYADKLVELAHCDGSTVHARMSKSAMHRHDDAVALVIFHDLTERLWLENH
jgi:PAS domain S-box-containing protein